MENEKLNIGDQFELAVSFSQDDVKKFAELTKDTNPLHIDPEFATKSIFKRIIVPGFLSGAVFSRVFGTIFPGIGTIYLYQEMKFKKPVFCDEKYYARFMVTQLVKEKKRAEVFCTLKSEQGETCIEGNAIIMHPEKIF